MQFFALCLVFVVGLLAFTGCANTRSTERIVMVKHTVFGLDISSDPATGGTPSIRLGLVRSFWEEIPTSTNRVYVAPLRSTTEADIHVTSQHVSEDLSTIPAGPAQ